LSSSRDLIAFGDGRADFVRFIETVKSDVKSFRIVPDHRFRRFRRRDVVAGVGLIEIFEDGGLLPESRRQASHR
jgi:hypothetical protein